MNGIGSGMSCSWVQGWCFLVILLNRFPILLFFLFFLFLFFFQLFCSKIQNCKNQKFVWKILTTNWNTFETSACLSVQQGYQQPTTCVYFNSFILYQSKTLFYITNNLVKFYYLVDFYYLYLGTYTCRSRIWWLVVNPPDLPHLLRHWHSNTTQTHAYNHHHQPHISIPYSISTKNSMHF